MIFVIDVIKMPASFKLTKFKKTAYVTLGIISASCFKRLSQIGPVYLARFDEKQIDTSFLIVEIN